MGKDYESLDTLFADDGEDGAVIVRNSSSSGGHNSEGDRTLVEKLLKMTDDDDEEDEDYTDSGDHEAGEGDGEVEDEGEETDEVEGAEVGEGASQVEVKDGEKDNGVTTGAADEADQEEEEDEDEDSNDEDEDDDELPSDVESEIEEDELQHLLQEAEEDLGVAGVTAIITAQSESSEGLPQRTLRKRTMTAAGVPSGAPVSSSSSSSEYQLTHSLEPEGEADVDKPLAVIKHGVVRVGRVVRFIQTHAPDATPEPVLSSQDKAMEEVLSVPLPSATDADTAHIDSTIPSAAEAVPIHQDSTAPPVEPATAALPPSLPLPLPECRWEVTYRKKGDDEDDDEEVKSEAAPAPADVVELSYSELK